jgi:hypothetical protein
MTALAWRSYFSAAPVSNGVRNTQINCTYASLCRETGFFQNRFGPSDEFEKNLVLGAPAFQPPPVDKQERPLVAIRR